MPQKTVKSLRNSASLRDFCAEPLHLQVLFHATLFLESLFTIIIKVLYIQNLSYWTGSVCFHCNQPHSPADSGALSVSSIEIRVCSVMIDPVRMSQFIIHILFKSV